MGTTLLLEAESTKDEKQKQFQQDLNAMGFPIYYILIEAVDVMNLIKYTFENNLSFSQDTYEKMKNWEGISGNIEFLQKGNTAYQYILVQYRNGQFIPVKK